MATGGPAEKVTGALTDALVKAIAYLATGAGFLTFIGATGAAVTWMRLDAAELPATQALQLVGVKHLVADGAVALIAFAVLGLIAVTFIYVVDVPSRDTDEMRHGVTLLAMSESLIAIWVANRYLDDVPSLTLALMGVVALGAVTIAISLIPERPPGRETWPKLLQPWGKFRGFWGPLIAKFYPPLITNQQLDDEIKRRELRAQARLAPEPPLEKLIKKVRLAPMLLLAVVVFLVGLGYVYWYHDWVGWSIWLAWGLAGFCFGVARTTERFWIYGMAIFVSGALFGAWLNIVLLTDSPQLSPAALLRTGNNGTSGVVGLYIARTDDRYWLGAVTMECEGADRGISTGRIKPQSGRIFSVPRSQVVDDTIGDRTRMGKVGDKTLVLLDELVQRQPPGGAPAPGAKPPATPSGADGAGRTDVMAADSPAAVPRTLAVSGRCMRGPPRLTGLSPSTAAPGDRVEITGTDLGFHPGEEDAVTVNGMRAAAPTRTWQNGRVVFTVPAVGARRAVVRIVVRGLTSNARALRIAHAR